MLKVSKNLMLGCTHDPFGANVAVGVVALAQFADGNAFRRGRVCEFSVADVNADMGNACA